MTPDCRRAEIGRCSTCSIMFANTGKDSETLNVIYVIDERGKLIDDLRIREFLLRPLDGPVRDLDGLAVLCRSTDEPEGRCRCFP